MTKRHPSRMRNLQIGDLSHLVKASFLRGMVVESRAPGMYKLAFSEPLSPGLPFTS